jgi:hypothetical protein
VLCVVQTGSAAIINAAASGYWTNTATWVGGVIPTSANSDEVRIPSGYAVTNNSTGSTAYRIKAGYSGVGSFTMISGDLSTTSFILIGNNAEDGVVNQSGGTLTSVDTYIGGLGVTNSTGILNLSGGTNITREMRVGYSGEGTVNLSGNAVSISSAAISLGYQSTATGIMNITGGQIITSNNFLLAKVPGASAELHISGGLLDISNNLVATNGNSLIEISGTNTSISVAKNLYLEDATLRVVPNEIGVSTINVGINATLGGALEVDMAEFPVSQGVLVLIQYGGSRNGEFSSVVVTNAGNTDISVVYDDDNKQVLLAIGGYGSQIVVTGERKQLLRLGIDAERLWGWKPVMSNELAQAAVGDLHAEFARVAINCAYEREEGVINATAYDDIVRMMEALRTANPAIKFFASPRPLFEAYTPEETEDMWGGAVPWSPYPTWVFSFCQDGTNSNGAAKWVPDTLYTNKLVRYLADYLNLMNEKGFLIDYLDVINENQFVTPEHLAAVSAALEGQLDPGVQMPLLVAPSAFSMSQGADFINAADSSTFDIASCHNTGVSGSPEVFAATAIAKGKEVWNSELHGWIGKSIYDSVLNSAILWRHLRAGFSGIDTWLFFGSGGGDSFHSMLNVGGNFFRTTVKYEIFKKLVNNANGGYYVETELPYGIQTTAFYKDNLISVWALNNSGSTAEDIEVILADTNLNASGKTVEITKWYGYNTEPTNNATLTLYDTQKLGEFSSLTVSSNSFTHTMGSNSLYCFIINMIDLQSLPFAEDFTGGAGVWWQSREDDFDWTENINGYLSAEGGEENTQKTSSVMCRFDFSLTKSVVLQFDYRIYGTNVNSLAVDVCNGNSWHSNVWVKSYSDNDWARGVAELSEFAGQSDVILRFRAQIGNFSGGDIALDNIRVDYEEYPGYGVWLANIFTNAPQGTGMSIYANPDGDRYLNLDEWILGTNPLVADGPDFDCAKVMNDFVVTYQRRSVPGISVRASWTESLTEPSWQTNGITEFVIGCIGDIETIKTEIPFDIAQKFIRFDLIIE